LNKQLLSSFLLLLFFLCCSEKEQAQVVAKNTIQNDSLSSWVAKSESPKITEAQRKSLIAKAYQLAINTKNDTVKAQHLSLLSFKLPSLADSSLYRNINKEAIKSNYSINDSLAIGNAYWDLAFFLDRNIVKDSAFYFYSEAQKMFDGIGNESFSGQMLYYMATLQVQIKDYVGSETTTIKAIEIFKPLQDNDQLFKCYNLLGIALGGVGEFEKSLAYYKEALYYLEQLPNPSVYEASLTNNIGIVYRNNMQYSEAIENFTKVLQTDSLIIKRPSIYALALSNLATTKLYQKDTSEVKSMLLRAIDLKRKENEIGSLASSYFNLAEYNAYARDTIKALLNAKEAEKLSYESNNNERLLETWPFLAILDKKNAPEYFEKYTSLNDSLQKEERKQQNKFARIRFETDEFIAENVELESEKELLSKQKQIWIGVAIGFFLLGLSIYIIINQRAKNQKLVFDQQQQANNQEIFNLMLTQKQKVDEVKRMEQKRISEELHDGILGKMLGARMILTGLNKRATEEAIQEKSKALKSLQEIENEIRSISHELSHTAYQQINNFTDSIEELLSNNKNGTIKTFFHYNVDDNWDSLAGDIKINVYRIIQETYQNAIKHANCSTFEVTFYRNDEQFSVILSDNGQGFNIYKGRKGIGLRNITSRVNKLNGTFHIDSSEGKGTTTSVQIPLKMESKILADNNT